MGAIWEGPTARRPEAEHGRGWAAIQGSFPVSGLLDCRDGAGAVVAPVAFFVLDDDVASAVGGAGGAGVSRGAGREGVDEELGALARAIGVLFDAALGFEGLGGRRRGGAGFGAVVVARGGGGEGGDTHGGDGDGADDAEDLAGLATEHGEEENHEREELSRGDALHACTDCKRSARSSCREIVGDRDRRITGGGVAGLHSGAKEGSRRWP